MVFWIVSRNKRATRDFLIKEIKEAGGVIKEYKEDLSTTQTIIFLNAKFPMFKFKKKKEKLFYNLLLHGEQHGIILIDKE